MATEMTAQEQAVKLAEAKAKIENDKRGKNKGTRQSVGQTRGRNPQVITWEAFDESIPESLPKDVDEFLKMTNTTSEAVYLQYLIDGYNKAQYTAASDPVAEFVDATWSDDVQKQFRIVVRNYATGANVSIEDAVALIKPGIVASQLKAKQEAEKAKAEAEAAKAETATA